MKNTIENPLKLTFHAGLDKYVVNKPDIIGEHEYVDISEARTLQETINVLNRLRIEDSMSAINEANQLRTLLVESKKLNNNLITIMADHAAFLISNNIGHEGCLVQAISEYSESIKKQIT